MHILDPVCYAKVSTIHVSRQGSYFSGHPRPTDVPRLRYRARETRTQYPHFLAVTDAHHVDRGFPCSYRHSFGFPDFQHCGFCPFVGPDCVSYRRDVFWCWHENCGIGICHHRGLPGAPANSDSSEYLLQHVHVARGSGPTRTGACP